MIKGWEFRTSSEVTRYGGIVTRLVDGQGRDRATIWENLRGASDHDGEYVWHTWDENGTGGENSAADTLNRAKDEVIAAIVRQGWAPGGWKVTW